MKPKNQLKRTLGLGLAIIIVAGNIIGSGVFKKVAPMASELGSPGWILICWVLGGIVTLFGALSNAEVASMMASTGGEYVYFKKIYNRFFSFLFGWTNFAAIKTASIAAIAYVFAQSLHSLVPFGPLLENWSDVSLFGLFFPFRGFSIKLVAIVLILFLTWFNTRGLKLGANLSTVVLSLVVLGILLIVFFGMTDEVAEPVRAFSITSDTGQNVGISAVFTALLAAFWAYEGWNSVGYLGGEIKNPYRNLPLSIIIGLFAVITIYLLINMAYLSVMPVSELQAVDAAGNQIAAVEVTRTFWGRTGVIFISILIVLSTFGCTHATIMSSPRVTFAMADEGLFFKSIGQVNKANVPGKALWLHGFWSCLLVFSGTFDQLTDMLIFAAFIFYGATALGVFILRKKMPDVLRPYRVWGYPFVPAVFVIFCVILIINTFITRPREAGIGMVLMLIGIPVYLWFRPRNKAVKTMSG